MADQPHNLQCYLRINTWTTKKGGGGPGLWDSPPPPGSAKAALAGYLHASYMQCSSDSPTGFIEQYKASHLTGEGTYRYNTWNRTVLRSVTRALVLCHPTGTEAALHTDVRTGSRWVVPVGTCKRTRSATGLINLAIGTGRC